MKVVIPMPTTKTRQGAKGAHKNAQLVEALNAEAAAHRLGLDAPLVGALKVEPAAHYLSLSVVTVRRLVEAGLPRPEPQHKAPLIPDQGARPVSEGGHGRVRALTAKRSPGNRFTGSRQSCNGKREGIPKKGKGRRKPASSKLTACALEYRERDRRQAQALDLFGPAQEWSTAAEHWPTLERWLALCGLWFNGNKNPHEFLMCFKGDKPKKAIGWKVAKHAEWAFNTLTGTANKPTAIGFYPYNAVTRDSFWCAVDFDTHRSQTAEQARAQAEKPVRYVDTHYPLLGVIACTSGASGGWHVFIARSLPWAIGAWSAFLRVCLKRSTCQWRRASAKLPA